MIFGKTKEGAEVHKYTLSNQNGMTLSVMDLGATILSITLPDKDGITRDVVLGYDSPVDYQENTCYFGAVIGRSANRIANARITLEGKDYQLEQNDNENNLHSGAHGFHSKIWTLENQSSNQLTFSVVSPDKEQDFPGTMEAKVTYTLTDENEVVLSYEATTDQTTVANFTNHSYFNLDGHDSGMVGNQELMLAASSYTPVIDAKSIPTGEIAAVAGTPMDFRTMTKIGDRINEDFDQLVFTGGYDHNYVIDHADGTMRLAARAKAAASGITMETYTDLPGIQFYAGNFVGRQNGKGGAVYDKRHGFCLETQYFPNSINDTHFKSPELKPGETYQATTKYKFQVEA